MNSRSPIQKHKNIIKCIIENYSLNELPHQETLIIKGSFCVFADSQLLFSIHLDEEINENVNFLNGSQIFKQNDEQDLEEHTTSYAQHQTNHTSLMNSDGSRYELGTNGNFWAQVFFISNKIIPINAILQTIFFFFFKLKKISEI